MRPRGFFFSTCVLVVSASLSGLRSQEPPPPNDACGNAVAVVAGRLPGAFSGTLAGATNDGSASVGQPGQPDVWYSFTAAFGGELQVSTCGSNDLPGIDEGLDTVLSVHGGCPGTPGNELAPANDDDAGGYCGSADVGALRDSAVAVRLARGQTAWIRVSRYNEATAGGFILTVSFRGEPASDVCRSAIRLADGAGGFSSDGASTDGPATPEACNAGGYGQIDADVWYCYTASCTGTATVSLCGSAFDTKLAVYEGCDCSRAFERGPIACNDDLCGNSSEVTFRTSAGTQYLVRIGGYQGQQGDGVVAIRCAPGPVNDCNGNGIEDSIDIANGTSYDVNANGIPDECESLPAMLADIEPRFVLTGGGTAVVVAGVNLTPAHTVQIGGSLLVAPSYVSPTEIRGRSPALPAGRYAVTLLLGESAVHAIPDAVEAVLPLAVTSFQPREASYLGREPFEVEGQGFTPSTSVLLSCASYTSWPLSVIFAGATLLAGTLPPDPLAPSPGPAAASVTVSDPVTGSVVLPNVFTYLGPLRATAVEPAVLSAGAGGAITIHGTGFTPATAVTIGGVALLETRFLDLRTIAGTAPPLAAGAYDLAVSDAMMYLDVTVPVTHVLPGAVSYQAEPSVSVSGTAVGEGDAGTVNAVFTLTLSAPSVSQVEVDFATADGSARAGTDYVARSGTEVFPPGATTRPVAVQVRGDVLEEPDETFLLRLTAARGAAIATAQATGAIRDDDAPLPAGNLVLEAFAADPDRTQVDAVVTLTARVRNAGTQAYQDVRVRFDQKGQLIETAAIPAIGAGAAVEARTSFFPEEIGLFSVSAHVNPGNVLPESSYDDNAAEAPLEVVLEDVPGRSKPDIVLSDLEIEPARPAAGARVSFRAELGNPTPNPVGPAVIVRLIIDRVMVDELVVEDLGTQQVALDLTWAAAAPGRHSATLLAYTLESLDEKDATNSQLNAWVRVAGASEPLPDLEVRGIDLEMGGPGEVPSISFEISNAGYAPARGVPVVVAVDGRELARTTIPALAAGAAVPLSAEWPGEAEGQHVVSVHVDPEDTVPLDNVQSVWSHAFTIPGPNYQVPAGFRENCWEFIGPRPIDAGSTVDNGRIDGIAVSKDSPLVIHVAAPTGGVWSTRDGGTTWTPRGDRLPAPDFHAIALDPRDDDVVYAASSAGIFRSPDGGVSWSELARSGWVGERVVDLFLRYERPGTHPDILTVYAGTSSGLWLWEGDRASAETVETEWHHAWTGSGAVSDMLITAEAAPRLYIASFRREVRRIALSTLLADLRARRPSTWDDVGGGLTLTGDHAILLGNSPAEPDLLYAAVYPGGADCRKDTGSLALYRRKGAEASWTLIGRPTDDGRICGIDYVAFLRVHPADSKILFFGGVKGWRSLDGGKTFDIIPYVHDDYKDMVFHPTDPTISFISSDGGIFRCTGNCQGCSSLNQDLETTQFFDIALSPTNASLVLGGTQDNGTLLYDGASSLAWKEIRGGDGMHCAFDPADETHMYTQHQYADSTAVTTGKGPSGNWKWEAASSGLPLYNEWNGNPFLAIHPADGKKLLIAAQKVYRTIDGGKGWTPLGPAIDIERSSNEAVAQIAIDAVKGRYYAGTDRGNVYAALESNPTSWSRIYDAQPWPRFSAGLRVDPGDPEVLYASFGAGSPWRVARIRHTGGWPGTWTPEDLTGDLAGNRSLEYRDIVRGLVKDPSRETLFVGTDRGVYQGRLRGTGWEWFPDNCCLPLTFVSDLEMHPSGDFLVAATFGRGAWKRPLVDFDLQPDRFDAPARNDTLGAAAFLGVVQEGYLQAGLVTEGLSLDRPDDVDFFTVEIPPGADECLADDNPALKDRRTFQGAFGFTIRATDAPDPYELKVYRNGQLFETSSNTSQLTFFINCPLRQFANRQITLSVRNPLGCLGRYDILFWYHKWYMRLDAPDLLYDPPMTRIIPKLGDMVSMFPLDPGAIRGFFLGDGTPFAEERAAFEWPAAGELVAEMAVEGDRDLAMSLLTAGGQVIARAQAAGGGGGAGAGAGAGERVGGGATAGEEGGGGAAKVLRVPDLPAGWYFLGFKDGGIGTYFHVLFPTLPEDGPTFRRGDPNGDRRVDISDGISILNYLFLGGSAPRCAEAANANDDSRLNMSDAIFIFAYLFLGGPDPPAPGPRACGPDATPPALEPCEGAGCP